MSCREGSWSLRWPAALVCVLALAACTGEGPTEPSAPDPVPGSAPAAKPTPDPEPAPEPTPAPVRPADFDAGTAMYAVRHLAGTIGAREATSHAHSRAADWVEGELRGLGYRVHRQRVQVPAGESWGVAVPAGRSVNVVATLPGVDRRDPHLVVGAHLDTVPQSPGAEDNASGVGVMLAVAEATARSRTRLPVVFVAFGAEEPRGPSDDDHHYGSRHFVDSLTPLHGRAMRAMVSLDRVGVGSVVPVGSAGDADPVQRSLVAAARGAKVPVVAVGQQRSSDHWSFVRGGLPAARLGSTPYVGYHSAGDVPAVVSRAQVRRVGRLVLAWLAPR